MIRIQFPQLQKGQRISNLKSNCFFLISAAAFFCLNITITPGYPVGLMTGMVLQLLICTQIPSIFFRVKKNTKPQHILSGLTALGVCWGEQSSFYADWQALLPKLLEKLSIGNAAAILPALNIVLLIVSIAGAAAALLFVYVSVSLFWQRFSAILAEDAWFVGIGKKEWLAYSALLTVSLIWMIGIFTKTEAFYGTEEAYNIIYNSDSAYLVRYNAYVVVANLENDIRQPLFALFAAPFIGLPCLIGKVLGGSVMSEAICMNAVQIAMLLTANLLLARSLRLDARKRVCFMVLSCLSYTYLLFILMMEQYIVAYFWLMLCLYQIIEKKHADPLVFAGAAGTLVTSAVLLPFASAHSFYQERKQWLRDLLLCGLTFAGLVLVFCRFDVIYSMIPKLIHLSDFAGREVGMAERFFQYTAFIRNCFWAPLAGETAVIPQVFSWQLEPASSVNPVGTGIFVLCVVSAVVNRRQKISRFAFGWICFSLVLLLGMGWGTAENGLILYSMYFGWAFGVLLFQLMEDIERRIGVRFLLPLLTFCLCIALIGFNFPSVLEMVHFAIHYYPA